jgi:hypothetical protein
MSAASRAPHRALVAICAAAMSTLVLQIALTRLLSATLSHHSAFAVIGLVMLGLATSASVVFVQRNRPVRPAGIAHATNALLLAALGCAVGSVGYPLASALGGSWVAPAMVFAGVLFFGLFFLAGYAIAFLLSEYAADAARLYWLDLTGAGVGCLVVVFLLDLGSPLVTVAWCGVLAAGAALALALDPRDGRTTLSGGALVGAALIAALLTAAPSLTALSWAKGVHQETLWEAWNRNSRVSVHPDIPSADQARAALRARYPKADAEQILSRWRIGWGMSDQFTGPVPETRWLLLDTDAGTQIVGGDAADVGERLRYLEYDVTAAAYHLRRDALDNVFVIGGGGGRDVLTALHFGAEAVDVAEFNPDVVRAVDEVFGDFSGRVYSHPRVDVTIGDARSTLSRSDERYDLVQMSMIDTWASSVAGALVLSENALYTAEAFTLYLERLEDDGLFSVSRWASRDDWGEAARTLSLVGEALRRFGVARPEDHVVLLRAGGGSKPGVATCIVKPTPFTDAERDIVRREAEAFGFDTLWPAAPGVAAELDVSAALRGDPQFARRMRLDLAPPTDDRPFFFELRPLFASVVWAAIDRDAGVLSRGFVITGALLAIYLVVARMLILEPLQRYDAQLPTERRTRLRNHLAPVGYFAMIGLGFMLIELGILQRYLTFLGHPTYAMSVVLFSLLLSSGLGASLSERIPDPARAAGAVAVLLVGVAFTALGVPTLLRLAHGLPLLARMGLAVALVVPLGVCLGAMFPLGVRMLRRDGLEHLLPWLWSVNGITGVIASMVGMMVAMSQGYTVLLLLGGACYVPVALAARRSWALEGERAAPEPELAVRAASATS